MDRITEQPNTSPGSIRRMLPDDETIYELADLFKMFGDPTRAKILGCLQIRDLYVGEIAEALGMSVSARIASAARAARRQARQGHQRRQGSQILLRRRPRDQDHGVRAHPRQRGPVTEPENRLCFFGTNS